MRKYTYATLICLLVSSASFAQPISGFMGKRFASSLELEIIPGFQGSYEVNTSEFLGFYTDYGYSYVPRLLANFEYQIKQKVSVSGAVGYAGMHAPIYFAVNGNTSYTYENKSIQPVQTVFIQAGFKMGLRKMSMPTASAYFAYRLGFYFNSMDAFSVQARTGNGSQRVQVDFDATKSMLVVLNLELGKRIVFNKGLFMDYGLALNLSPAVFYSFKDEYEINYSDPEYLESTLNARVATNSLINFKIAFGLFY